MMNLRARKLSRIIRRKNARLTPVLDVLESRTLLSTMPLLVQLKPGVSASILANIPTDANGVTIQSTDIAGLEMISGSSDVLSQLQATLSASPNVQYAEPESIVTTDLSPTDPQYVNGTQWDMNGTYGINAPAAWDVTTGSGQKIVADIDTGIDYNNPDLYDNVWINQPEIPKSRMANLTDVFHDGYISMRDLNSSVNQGPGKIMDQNGDGIITAADLLAPMTLSNGVDTGMGGWANPNNTQDGDTAHPDDLVGWNFVTNTNDPYDDYYHGTHTAGTIGMMANDGVGGAGVDWSVSIMALKFIASNGNGTDLAAADAIDYSYMHGAKVSNNSYGGGDQTSPIEGAIQRAMAAGAVFVAAAGNSGVNTDTTPNYPSAYTEPNIIAVAATDINGARASFSNYGATSVDLGAPGVNIYSTLNAANGSYGYLSGTSMATPHVTGTVALLQVLHPTWTYSQVINQILSTVTPVASMNGVTVSGGILNAGAAITQSVAASATFLKADTSTQGTWTGNYGTDGYDIAQSTVSLASYATVSLSGQGDCVWAASTTDPRALQTSSGSSSRIAGSWYATQSFLINVNVNDSQAHPVSLYALDWDSGGRSERIDVINPATNAVLDTETVSSFTAGKYLTWNVKGNVEFKVTALSGPNAVISGVFFGLPATPSSATFVKTDTTTQGTWNGAYGPDGYDVAQSSISVPSYATLSLAGQSDCVWAASTTDVRGLQTTAGSTSRLAGSWYATNSFTINVNLTDGLTHAVSLYALDWDKDGRSERIDVINPSTGAILDTETVSNFTGGTYLTWNLKGAVTFKVTAIAGPNAVISGVFFGVTSTQGSATFVGSDTATQGTWNGSYGTDGYDVAQSSISLPSYATVSLSGQGDCVWAASTTDVRGLQTTAGSTSRLAGSWYATQSFTINVNLTDGLVHPVSIYALDWDRNGRSERVDVIDASSGTVLDTETLSNFSGGTYLTWNLKGNIQIKVTTLAGPNSVISGIFFGLPSTKNSASFVGSDATTQGSWNGAYGSNGYDVAESTLSAPSYGSVSLQGQGDCVWASSTTDVRGLQTTAGSTSRLASSWYATQSFAINVNLTDGQSHAVSLYALDWDKDGRSERIDVIDPTTGAVLDTETISNFTGGTYLTWNVTGKVQFRVTSLSGPNAVISGVFFGKGS